MNLRRTLQLSLGIGLSMLFLYLALRGEDWGAIRTELGRANLAWLLPMVVLGVYGLFVRSQRWKLLLDRSTGTDCPIGPVFSASAIGFMANMVLPFRVGEVVRPYLVSTRTHVTMTTSFATVVLERILDLLVLFAFAVWVVLVSDVPDLVKQLTWVAGGVAGVAAIGAYGVAAQRERVTPILDQLWRKLPSSVGDIILRLEHEFLDGVAPITDPVVLVKALLWSFYVWGLIAVTFACGLLACGIDIPFFSGGVVVTTLVALAVSIPSAPGFIGPFEWGCKLALEQVFGVPGAVAVGYAVIVHVTQFSTQVVLGLVYLAREGLSFRDLGQMEAGPGDQTEASG